MPTWFMDRKVFHDVGGFEEVPESKACVKTPIPEDLIFFLKVTCDFWIKLLHKGLIY